MTNYGKRLAIHPGVPAAAGVTLIGAMIGARCGPQAALQGAALMGVIAWAPVLVTARTQPLPENDNREEGGR